MTPSRAPRGGAYAPNEDAYLRQNYAKQGRAKCAQELNRTEASIKNRAQRLGLTRTRPTKTQRSDRELAFSPLEGAPTPLTELGKPREYPRVTPLGQPCEKHPGNTIGMFGCPACNAGQRWADRQRQTVARPHHEGGR